MQIFIFYSHSFFFFFLCVCVCFLANLQLPNRFQRINQMVNSSERAHKRTLDFGPTPKPLKRLRFDVDGQDEADGRLVTDSVVYTDKQSHKLLIGIEKYIKLLS